MIRWFLRMLGYVALSGCFIAIVYDGTRSIAAASPLVTPLGELWIRTAPALLAKARDSLAALPMKDVSAALLDLLLRVPTVALLAVIALILLRLGATPSDTIGIDTRR